MYIRRIFRMTIFCQCSIWKAAIQLICSCDGSWTPPIILTEIYWLGTGVSKPYIKQQSHPLPHKGLFHQLLFQWAEKYHPAQMLFYAQRGAIWRFWRITINHFFPEYVVGKAEVLDAGKQRGSKTTVLFKEYFLFYLVIYFLSTFFINKNN